MKYSKPPLSFDFQVEKLIERGMEIPDKGRAIHYLSHLNYYRLGGYWLPFEKDHATHEFRPGTTFEKVLNLYVFDRALRILLIDAIERVEVSVRTQWAYHLSHTYGPHALLDKTIFSHLDRYNDLYRILKESVDRSQEAFVIHIKSKYDEPLPPVWAACELMTLGHLSKWYSIIRKRNVRQEIARCYGIDQKILISFLRHLTIIRNVCAHHGRLWNKPFPIRMLIPEKPTGFKQQFNTNSNRVYNTLTMLNYLLGIISPNHGWTKRLLDLIAKHAINTKYMGFPEGYINFELWTIR